MQLSPNTASDSRWPCTRNFYLSITIPEIHVYHASTFYLNLMIMNWHYLFTQLLFPRPYQRNSSQPSSTQFHHLNYSLQKYPDGNLCVLDGINIIKAWNRITSGGLESMRSFYGDNYVNIVQYNGTSFDWLLDIVSNGGFSGLANWKMSELSVIGKYNDCKDNN